MIRPILGAVLVTALCSQEHVLAHESHAHKVVGVVIERGFCEATRRLTSATSSRERVWLAGRMSALRRREVVAAGLDNV